MHFILPNAFLVTLENLLGILRVIRDCVMRTVVNRKYMTHKLNLF
jgi:hypothetical protein